MKTWLKGLISAATGGVGAVVGLYIDDPSSLMTSGGLKRAGIVAAVSGGIAVLNYLKQSPLP